MCLNEQQQGSVDSYNKIARIKQIIQMSLYTVQEQYSTPSLNDTTVIYSIINLSSQLLQI